MTSRLRPSGGARLRREQRTVQVMVSMYCRGHHKLAARSSSVTTIGGARLCPDCAALLDYAGSRIDACRFGEQKPTCARCPVHCFRTADREAIRTVMRYAGPRMVLRHPYLAVRHLLERQHSPRSL